MSDESTEEHFDEIRILNSILGSVFASCLIVLYAYNFWRFMLIQKRYTQLLQVVFYAAALTSIVFNIVLAWVAYDCDWVNEVMRRSIPFLNLIIGSYIATQLKILALQLKELIASKDEFMSVQDPTALTPYMRIRRLKLGKRCAYILFVL